MTCSYMPWCDSDTSSDDCCLRCRRDARRAKLDAGKCEPFYIVAYGVSRLYGGPEEGGWWYDWTDVHEVRRVYTLQGALRAARELREAYPPPRFDRFSMAGGEDQYVRAFYSEAQFPEQSTRRPHYE